MWVHPHRQERIWKLRGTKPQVAVVRGSFTEKRGFERNLPEQRLWKSQKKGEEPQGMIRRKTLRRRRTSDHSPELLTLGDKCQLPEG